MADFFATGAAGGNNHRLDWTLNFDDAANTVTITVTHAKFDGSAQAGPPGRAWITVSLNSGQPLTVDTATGEIGVPNGPLDDPTTILTNRQPFSQSVSGSMLNAGPRVRTGVRLSVSPRRSQLITCSTQYQPPAS